MSLAVLIADTGRTYIGPLQDDRGSHALIGPRVARTSDLPALAAPLPHPVARVGISIPQKAADRRRSVEGGSVLVARRGGEHGVGMAMGGAAVRPGPEG